MNIQSNLKLIYGSILGGALILLLPASAYGQHDEGHEQEQQAVQHDEGHEHEEHAGGHGGGEPGIASEVSRTIEVTMTDNRYTLEQLSVEVGETIRFVAAVTTPPQAFPAADPARP